MTSVFRNFSRIFSTAKEVAQFAKEQLKEEAGKNSNLLGTSATGLPGLCMIYMIGTHQHSYHELFDRVEIEKEYYRNSLLKHGWTHEQVSKHEQDMEVWVKEYYPKYLLGLGVPPEEVSKYVR